MVYYRNGLKKRKEGKGETCHDNILIDGKELGISTLSPLTLFLF
jgi:hypothetical protein